MEECNCSHNISLFSNFVKLTTLWEIANGGIWTFPKQSGALGRDYMAFIEIAESLYFVCALCNGLGGRMCKKSKKRNRRNFIKGRMLEHEESSSYVTEEG